MDRLQETQWWDAVQKQDDRHGFARLYLRYWERLYAIAWARTRDESLSQDIVQDVFVALWEQRKTTVIQTGISRYLTGMLKYRLMDYFQSRKAARNVLDHALHRIDTFEKDSSNHLSYADVEGIFEEELAKMPENMRRSLLLRLDKKSTPRIAAQLDLAEQTVSNLLTEAFKRLRKTLSHRLNECSFQTVITLSPLLHDLLINA